MTSEYSENIAKDSVIRTVPASGSELTRNQSIILVVSSGKERFAIPDVHDQSQDDAQAALTKFPFQISVVQQTSDSVSNGNVIGTDPSAGTQVKRGQTVRLLVSSGQPKPPINAPFQGKSGHHAEIQSCLLLTQSGR